MHNDPAGAARRAWPYHHGTPYFAGVMVAECSQPWWDTTIRINSRIRLINNIGSGAAFAFDTAEVYLMKPLLVVLALAGTSLLAGTHVSIGIGIGAPVYSAPPPPVAAYAYPPCPGPAYVWVPGYWYPAGPRYRWRAGYWAVPPYRGSYWVAPRYTNSRYYAGHWRRPQQIRFRDDDWDRRGGRNSRDRDHRRHGQRGWRR
jgi:hypothetical protein